MERLQVSLDVRDQHCLVVGGGSLAAQRVASAVHAGARVTVLAPALDEAMQPYVASGRIEWHQRAFVPGDAAGFQLVFAASQCARTDSQVAAATAAHGGLCSTEDPDPPEGHAADMPRPGLASPVHLVGAGPGDPGLLTVDGLRALQQADVILHDRLVSSEMLDLAPESAERVFVGKQRSHHHYSQDELNTLMVDLARSGKRVVRLKGGDPYMFGRGGEEAGALAEAGVDYCVIPGVTAGSGCATYAGIPLTHRDHAHACQFITAHDKDGECDHDWAALVRPRQTLVVYMGLHALRGLCPKLIEHGMDPGTPAALIEHGTTPEQRVLVGTVSTLPEIAAAQGPSSPAVVIVGEVVRLGETLGDTARERPDNHRRPRPAGKRA